MSIIQKNKMSPMFVQWSNTKEKYPDCLLFYRLGDFYELFFEDAEIGSKVLDITLTEKVCGNKEYAPMCGVPYHAYEAYVQKLIEAGYKVAICEQLDLDVNTKTKLVTRDVVRIITPGTIIDSVLLNDSKNTYMMCIYKAKDAISYAYGDISTGEIFVGECVGRGILDYINDQIVRVMPAEIICNHEAMSICESLPCAQNNGYKFSEYFEWVFKESKAEEIIQSQYNLDSTKGYDFSKKELLIPIGALLQYFLETQKRELKHISLPQIIKDEQYMYVDTNTRRNLEIEQTMREGNKYGSLLWVLDETKTSAGARMLRNWVRQPLQNRDEINARLNMVECLVKNPIISAQLENSLKSVQDIERIVGKASYGNLTPKDCIGLARSLDQVPQIKTALYATGNQNFKHIADNMQDVSSIANIINATIKLDAPTLMKDGGYIREGFNANLDKLRNMKQTAEAYILNMQQVERETTGIKNLKIGYNKVFGYYIEVSKQFSEQVPFRYIRKQTVSNNERYITEELKKFEEDVLTSHDRALQLEAEIFTSLREQIRENISVLQKIANLISCVDCIFALSEVAVNNDYVKPNITNDHAINIIEGRHPVIEKVAKNSTFIPNDCNLNDEDQRTMILTGPNMAGKSTYMRQVALITYMAHIGSFVPAKSADICIVDRIFTRIGASDDLAVGQSTFMVEMIEVANILHYATNNSLIILDEVGRGTSTFDGLSIAWSVVEYLSKKLKAKTLFATHYHELMKLEGLYSGVKNFCISIKEFGGKLVFLRKIMRGSATKSYGIEVASLAGLPLDIINRAKDLMKEFEQDTNSTNCEKDSELINRLREIDVNSLSPRSAFDILLSMIDLVN